ncbi:MAG: hypothetical protein HC795_00900 [Coleofasciculaceae cyanobacterium RL_1_1]|nr:hypothetical protein [Coleofasciculaceae cyanobacterium RL_1_1]
MSTDRVRWSWRLVGIIALNFGLIACNGARPEVMAIADLVPPTTEGTQSQSDPQPTPQVELNDQVVVVSGVIVRRVPLVNGAVYLLEDDTSAIWVRTDRSPDETEREVLVSGTLQTLGVENSESNPKNNPKSNPENNPAALGLQNRYLQEQTRSPVEASP